MSGYEVERVLSLINENIGANDVLLRSEVFQFIEDNEDLVLDQLRAHESATIPTSFGKITLNLDDLRRAVA